MAKRRPKRSDVRNIVVVSDLHVGCRLGLIHPDGAELDDGGVYKPSRFQLKLWDIWQDFWCSWVPQVTHGEPFTVVCNGDCIDGVHHGSTTQWSQNLEDQGRQAIKILKPIVELCEGRYYHVRGTEAHVGRSGVEEERVARAVGAIPNEVGQHARWDLWIRMADGNLCHFLHHVGTTSSSAHEASAINAELAAMITDSGRWADEPPLVVCRSHRHRCFEVRGPAAHGCMTCFVTGCWQGKTPFAWKVAGARVTTPQIGGSLIRVGGEEIHTRHYVKSLGRSQVV
jgi:hypothetical protein